MKRFILGAIAALLVATSANATTFPYLNADSTEIAVGAATNDAWLEMWGYDDRVTGFVDVADIISHPSANPSFVFNYPDDVWVGSSKLSDMLANKADASALTALSTTVSGLSFTQQPSDWTASSGVTRILNKPTLFDGAYSSLTGQPSLFSGSYTDLTSKPTLFSGAYTDLTGKPTLFDGTYASLTGKPTIPTVPVSYEGTTSRAAYFVYKSSTVASGAAIFQLTADNTSTGTALCSNPIAASVNPVVNDATASYQYGWAFSNSNKTLTVTTNMLSTANILTGILGQSAANGKAVNLSVACY